MKDDVEVFRTNVERIRRARGLTARGLSLAIGRGESYVQSLETGLRVKSIPKMPIVEALARELSVTPDQLLGREPSIPLPPLDIETARMAELGRAVLRLVRGSARPTPEEVAEMHRRRLQREFAPEIYAKIVVALDETQAAYERMVGQTGNESPDDPATPFIGREA